MGAIASLFATIGIDTSSLDKGLGGSKSQLLGFGKELAKATIGTLSLATATYKAGKAVIDSIRDWADYADTMRMTAEMAGITTEEMSKIVQAADDFRVPIETMQRSMEMALKNGFTPTIDNLAALSDELLAIEDPATRAAKASEIFGKSYADMMPFLLAGGDAIRDATESISDSLVVTQQAADDAKAYKDAVDELSDSWTGLKNTLGREVLPVITEVFNQINESNSISALREQFNDVAKAALEAGKITKDQYNDAMKQAYDRTKTTDETVEFLEYHLAMLGVTSESTASSTEDLSDAESGLSESALLAADAAIEAAEAQAKMNAELENITSLEGNYQGIIDLAYDYTDMLEEKETLQIERQKLINQGWSEQSQKVKDLDANIAGIDASMAELADRVTLDMFQATIAVGGVTQAELGAYMQMAIDMGYMSEEGAKAAMAAYGNAIETINGLEIDEKTGNVTVDATAAFATFDLLEQYVLLDKEQRVFVRTYYGTSGNYDPYENYTGPQYEHGGGASGGYFMADTPYIVGERGPELFVPNESGQVISNDKLLELLGGNGKTGNTYNLVMPTTANPMDVKMAFELMEAWNG